MTPVRALQRLDGYLPIEDRGLIGDGRGCALVGHDTGISWMCVPRFDSPPLVCGLLDRQRGGEFLGREGGCRDPFPRRARRVR